MRTFSDQYIEDLRVMAALQEKADPEDLAKIRARIDQMTSLNMRRAALEMWSEKIKVPAR